MLRRTRLLLLFCALLFCSSSARIGQLPIAPELIRITLEPTNLSNDPKHLRRTGKLIYLAGWAMRADHPDFGGWSAMVPHKGGLRLMSDAGALLDMPLPSGAAVTGRISEIPKGCGFHWIKEKQDSESLTVDPVSGQSWIGLENINRICRFAGDHGRAVSIARPEMRNWQITRGPEAMVKLHDGRFLVFAEADPEDSGKLTPVLVFKGDPLDPRLKPVTVILDRPKGYQPVDAAQLPDGRLLVLYRLFSVKQWFRNRLYIFDVPARFRPAMLFRGREIARLEAPWLVDNFEALAVTQERRRTIIWLASDDNFWPLQRSYLLKFALDD
ncbi:esterase-like activity of phytase family protein [Chakrabartia godavariana]|nr:esterase-like activity of phytase family protein [Chakrabartia godavariana]